MARLFNPDIATLGTDPANQQLVQQGLAQLQDRYDKAKELEFNARLQAGESFLNADDLERFNQDVDNKIKESYKNFDGKIGFGANQLKQSALNIMQHPAKKLADKQKRYYEDVLKHEAAGNIVLNKKDILAPIFGSNGEVRDIGELQVVNPEELTKAGMQIGQSYISSLTPTIRKNATMPGYVDITRMSPKERDMFLAQNGQEMTNEVLAAKGIDPSKLTAEQRDRLYSTINNGLSLGLTDDVKTQEDKAYWMNLQMQKQKELYNWKESQEKKKADTPASINPKARKTEAGTKSYKEIFGVNTGKELLDKAKDLSGSSMYKNLEKTIDERAKSKIGLDIKTSEVNKVPRDAEEAKNMVDKKWKEETEWTPFQTDNKDIKDKINSYYTDRQNNVISLSDTNNQLLKNLEKDGLVKWDTKYTYGNPIGDAPSQNFSSQYIFTDAGKKAGVDKYIDLQNKRIEGRTPSQLAREKAADDAINDVEQKYTIQFNPMFKEAKDTDEAMVNDLVSTRDIYKLIPTDKKSHYKLNKEGTEDYWSDEAKEALQFGLKDHKYDIVGDKVYLTLIGKDSPKANYGTKGGTVETVLDPTKDFDRNILENLGILSDTPDIARDAILTFDFDKQSEGISLNDGLKRYGYNTINGGDEIKVQKYGNKWGVVIDGQPIAGDDYRSVLERALEMLGAETTTKRYARIKSELFSTPKQQQAEVNESYNEMFNEDL